ncbi:plasmid replication initiator TrfA [Plasticicumulans sp.]|uniref:plasmid replication initiator TrfA n=1 Tax=Plasticicumulans sp. TaxID=2307179 RepID=UPI002D08BF6E|nr:plasmid replication initiator TrfA [Plasticicumulans sp.]HMV39050.1 plasmid replication initiator TrfA [Plasticicumulans sp.]HMW29898.1 plasmid replication initiator TrfA [Plasticicumulans sp.]HMW42550.1 plasmid replication initiator TrfA [Plasticicumulans sp.]HMX53088.1 plasmid replication initiator TrfA [Plasticicumulans sp.]HNB89439.1 plasmid replication initiator TrfA [Plasticicumulans sp.]
MVDPVQRINALQERAAVTKPPALPRWEDWQRSVPNEVVRSALFTVGNRRDRREFLVETELAAIGETQVTYQGVELRQDDEDVWLQALHLAREQPLDAPIEFVPHAFLRAIGWPTTGHYYALLRDAFGRMQRTTVTFRNQRLHKGLSISLIRRFEWSDRDAGGSDDRCKVWIEPEMRLLFGNTQYTRIEWEQRRHLRPLAKWLHGYFASHRTPLPVRVVTLRDACGSDTRELRNFRPKLKAALTELVEACFLSDWQIDETDLVHVCRAPAPGVDACGQTRLI